MKLYTSSGASSVDNNSLIFEAGLSAERLPDGALAIGVADGSRYARDLKADSIWETDDELRVMKEAYASWSWRGAVRGIDARRRAEREVTTMANSLQRSRQT